MYNIINSTNTCNMQPYTQEMGNSNPVLPQEIPTTQNKNNLMYSEKGQHGIRFNDSLTGASSPGPRTITVTLT